MSGWIMRVTICVPEAMRHDANDLAMVLGSSAADAGTFGAAAWVDAEGNGYCVASTLARATFSAAAGTALQRPDWDAREDGEAYVISMAAARRAQAALVIYDADAPRTAAPDIILAVIADDPVQAVSVAGLTRSA